MLLMQLSQIDDMGDHFAALSETLWDLNLNLILQMCFKFMPLIKFDTKLSSHLLLR